MDGDYVDMVLAANQRDADEAAARAKELSDLREAMSKITVLAHSALRSSLPAEHVRALVWIKKACADVGYTVTAVNGKPTT